MNATTKRYTEAELDGIMAEIQAVENRIYTASDAATDEQLVQLRDELAGVEARLDWISA